MEGRMTVCNMTIEGGGRAGMIAPDETTFACVEGRAAAPHGATSTRRRALAQLPTDDGRDVRPRDHRRRRRDQPAGHLGHEPRAGRRRSPTRVPRAARATATSARSQYMGLEAGHADRGDQARPRLHRLLHELAHRRPARRRRGRQGPQGRRRASTRWSSPARAGEGAGRGRGPRPVFSDAGFDWRDAGCSMCLAMNPDILQPGERCASTSNRNFEGRQGTGGRTHLVPPQMAAAAAIAGHFVDIRDWSWSHGARSTTITGPRLGPGPRRRRHRPDHPQAVPQADRAHRLRRVPLLRLGARSPAGTCRRNPILVAGRNFGCGSSAASTRRGRSRTTASRRSSRRSSPTSSTPTARRSGCCRSR